MDKVNFDNILLANKCINTFPLTFIDWFDFTSTQHSYQTSSLAKRKLVKAPFKTISYVKNFGISSAIQSWDMYWMSAKFYLNAW